MDGFANNFNQQWKITKPHQQQQRQSSERGEYGSENVTETKMFLEILFIQTYS